MAQLAIRIRAGCATQAEVREWKRLDAIDRAVRELDPPKERAPEGAPSMPFQVGPPTHSPMF